MKAYPGIALLVIAVVLVGAVAAAMAARIASVGRVWVSLYKLMLRAVTNQRMARPASGRLGRAAVRGRSGGGRPT